MANRKGTKKIYRFRGILCSRLDRDILIDFQDEGLTIGADDIAQWQSCILFGIPEEVTDEEMAQIDLTDNSKYPVIGALDLMLIRGDLVPMAYDGMWSFGMDTKPPLSTVIKALAVQGEPLDLEPEQQICIICSFELVKKFDSPELREQILMQQPNICYRCFHTLPDLLVRYPEGDMMQDEETAPGTGAPGTGAQEKKATETDMTEKEAQEEEARDEMAPEETAQDETAQDDTVPDAAGDAETEQDESGQTEDELTQEERPREEPERDELTQDQSLWSRMKRMTAGVVQAGAEKPGTAEKKSNVIDIREYRAANLRGRAAERSRLPEAIQEELRFYEAHGFVEAGKSGVLYQRITTDV